MRCERRDSGWSISGLALSGGEPGDDLILQPSGGSLLLGHQIERQPLCEQPGGPASFGKPGFGIPADQGRHSRLIFDLLTMVF